MPLESTTANRIGSGSGTTPALRATPPNSGGEFRFAFLFVLRRALRRHLCSSKYAILRKRPIHDYGCVVVKRIRNGFCPDVLDRQSLVACLVLNDKVDLTSPADDGARNDISRHRKPPFLRFLAGRVHLTDRLEVRHAVHE